MDREGSNRNEFETFARLLFIANLPFDRYPPRYQHRGNSSFRKDVYSFQFFFFFLPFFLGVCAKFLKIVWSLTAFLFFFFCKMFFSSSISTSVQKSEGEIDYSSILERCYIVQGKRNCWYRSIKSPEGKEFSQFAGVIVTKRFHPISNSSISIESPIQARRYQNITRHGATTIVNNPHPPL